MPSTRSLTLRGLHRSLSTLFALTLVIVPVFSFGQIPIGSRRQGANAILSGRKSPILEPSPGASPLPQRSRQDFSISKSGGKQGTEHEVIVSGNECLKDPTKAAYQISDLRLHAPTGSGITVENLRQTDCQLVAKLSIAADAPLGLVKLWVIKPGQKDNDKNLVPTVDFNITGVTVQPLPPGLNNQGQVDVMWSVVPDKIANHNFGRGVQKHFYCIEVVIGNNSGFDLQLSSVGFTLPALGAGYTVPNSGYRTVRGSLEAFGEVAPRKFVVNGLKMLGPILTGFLPFFHATNHKANFSGIVNFISNPLEKGLENVWPDLLPTQLDRLADQTYRDDVSTKTIIPHNVQARILTFVPKRLVCPDKKTCLQAGSTDKKINPENVQDVMRALGQIVIVGQQVQHVNRVRVVNDPFGTSIIDHSISGRITDACNQGVGGVEVTLSAGAGFLDRTVTTSDDGGYTFPNVPDGRTYTVTPAVEGKFRPASSPPFLLNDTKTNLNFSTDYLVITGKVAKSDGEGLVDVNVKLTGSGLAATTEKTKAGGVFRFEVPSPGLNIFEIKPDSKAFTFEPDKVTWECDKRVADFVATPTPSPSPTPPTP